MKEQIDKEQASGSSQDAPGHSFLPNLCALHGIFAVVLTTELVAVVFTFILIDSVASFGTTFSLISLYLLWISLATTACLCAVRDWLNRLPVTLVSIAIWLIMIGLAVFIAYVAGAISPIETSPHELMLKSLVISMVAGLLILLYLHLQYRLGNRLRAEAAAHQLALQARIRPHFLFNSMNTIAALTRSDPAKAEETVINLADLFRVALASPDQCSNLGQELALARHYLDIEHHRLGERLQVDWDTESLPEDAKMPSLILQPLLENAVYHGIEPSESGGRIGICGELKGSKIHLTIRNTLPESQHHTHRKGNRIALDNIQQRLQWFYDDQARMMLSEVEGEFQVRLVLPHPWSPS